MLRRVAMQTRSDERSLRLGFVAISISLVAIALLYHW